jgi:hypothetical protein
MAQPNIESYCCSSCNHFDKLKENVTIEKEQTDDNLPSSKLLEEAFTALQLKDRVKQLDKKVVISHYKTKNAMAEKLVDSGITWDNFSKAELKKMCILLHKKMIKYEELKTNLKKLADN